MPGALDSCINNVFEDGNIPASSGTTPVRVLLKPALAAAIDEAASASDTLDAFAGEIIAEAASAADIVDATSAVNFMVVETATATVTQDGVVIGTVVADVVETATATDDPSATVTAAPSDDWSLVDTWTHSGNVAQVDFTGLAGYTEIRVLVRGVPASAGNSRVMRVSTNNGTSFLSASGDYIEIGTDGIETNQNAIFFIAGASSAAATGEVIISSWNLTTSKTADVRTKTSVQECVIPTTSALNAVRIANVTGDLSGGSIYVFAR